MKTEKLLAHFAGKRWARNKMSERRTWEMCRKRSVVFMLRVEPWFVEVSRTVDGEFDGHSSRTNGFLKAPTFTPLSAEAAKAFWETALLSNPRERDLLSHLWHVPAIDMAWCVRCGTFREWTSSGFRYVMAVEYEVAQEANEGELLCDLWVRNDAQQEERAAEAETA